MHEIRRQMTSCSKELYQPIGITSSELFKRTFTHITSDIFDDISVGHSRTITDYSGFCEWKSTSTPSLTLGWDWAFFSNDYSVAGEFYTNFVILSEDKELLTNSEFTKLLLQLVATLQWEKMLISQLNKQYQ
jgi:hypothetical protein